MGRGRCASVLLKCMGMYPANQGVLWGLLPWPLDIRLSYSRTASHHTRISADYPHTCPCLDISAAAYQPAALHNTTV